MVIDGDKHAIAMKKLSFLSYFFVDEKHVQFGPDASGGLFFILSEIMEDLTPQEGNQIEVSK